MLVTRAHPDETKGATGAGMIVPVTRAHSVETKGATGAGMIVPVTRENQRNPTDHGFIRTVPRVTFIK